MNTSLTLGFKLGLRRTLFRFAQQQTVFHFSMIKTSFFTLQCTESKLKQVLLRRVHVQKGNYVKVWRSQHPEEFKLLIYSTNINFNSKTIPSLQTDRSDSLLYVHKYQQKPTNQQTNVGHCLKTQHSEGTSCRIIYYRLIYQWKIKNQNFYI